MSLNELASQTRTVHFYEPGVGPSKDQLKQALKTCLMAPNHKRSYPWKIILASSDTRMAIADVAYQLKLNSGASEEDSQAAKSKNLAAKELIIFILKKLPEDTFREREDYATISCSIQLLGLSLREMGFGYKWSTGKVSRSLEVAEILGLGENEEVVGFVWAGKEAKALAKVLRPELSEVLSEI